MTAIHSPRTPQSQSASYRAAALIHAAGPIPRAELFAKVYFSARAANSTQILNCAIAGGWLAEIPEGVTLTDKSRAHFGSKEAASKPKYVGQVATSREPLTPLYERPALSAKHIPSSKGFREDVPAYSVRDGVSFRTVGGSV